MSKRYWRRIDAETGASAVEFAIVLPLLVMLVFGIIQFGLAFFRTQGMEAATREAGRVAALGLDGVEIRAAFDQGIGAVPISSAHVDVCISELDDGGNTTTSTCTPATHSGCSERTVEVVARVQEAERGRYAIAIPFVQSSEPSYESTARFRCELHEGG